MIFHNSFIMQANFTEGLDFMTQNKNCKKGSETHLKIRKHKKFLKMMQR